MYDPSSSMRRPVIDIEVDEYPLTCMSVRSSNKYVVVMCVMRILWHYMYTTFLLLEMAGQIVM